MDELFYAVVVPANAGVLRGHILVSKSVQTFGATSYVVCGLAQAFTPPFPGTPFWDQATGWFVAKSIRPFPLDPTYNLVEVYSAGDTMLASNIDPAIVASWLATSAFGVYLSMTPGLPAPGFPETTLPVGQYLTTHLVAYRLTLADPTTGVGEAAWRIASELTDVVKTAQAALSVMSRSSGGRIILDT